MLKCTRKQQADGEMTSATQGWGPVANPFVFLNLSTPSRAIQCLGLGFWAVGLSFTEHHNYLENCFMSFHLYYDS